MIKSNIIMLTLSIIVILFLIIFGLALVINRDLMYLIPVVALIVYLIYTIQLFLREYKIYKADDSEGIREGVMQFRRVSIFRNVQNSRSQGPYISVGQFKVVELDSEDKHGILGKWISLSGDYSHTKLVNNKRYRVCFYVNSRRLVSIEAENNQ